MTQQEQQVKQAFFMTHCGCEYAYNNGSKTSTIGGYAFMHEVVDGDSHLLLTPLQNITDEDLHGLSIKTGFTLECFPTGWRTKGTKVIFKWRQGDIGYLRSCGYLLPFRSYSVERILEMGWAKLKGGGQ